MKHINLSNWNRKEHYLLFSKMKSPFFGITAEVNCTNAYNWTKSNNISFFAYYLHKSMMAVNSIPEFKYRIIDNEVYELDKINAGATISRNDRTFAFIYVDYNESFEVFNNALQEEIRQVHSSVGLRLNNDDIKKDLIRHSTIPWSHFTSILHPTNFDHSESVPKITFGGIYKKDGKVFMPVSVEAHHGLMDGSHICEYFAKFEELLNSLFVK
ncbi:MAG: CatA-like O-acetyltransferase [Bacteroidales bacterium]